MARGERPRPERSTEERERARAERERRRAERAGQAPPAEAAPAAVPAPAGENGHGPPEAPVVPPDPVEPPLVPPDPVEPPIVPPDPVEPPIAPPEPVEPPIAPPDPPEPPAAPPEPPEALAAPAQQAQPPAPPPDAIDTPAFLTAEEGHAPADPTEAADAPAAAEPPETGGESEHDEPAGYAIPGLPEDPGPQPRQPLPEPPPRVRRAEQPPMRRAFRRGGGGGGGGTGAAGLASGGRDRRRGRISSRWAAVVALIVIGVVVALLLYGLTRSSNHTTAKAPPVVKVLIPEGKTRLQIAQIASAAGLKGSYRRAARSSPLLNPAQYGAPHDTSTLEGFLFPATYDMDKGAPSARLVEEQLTAFQENFTSEYAKRAGELGLTPYELLTVASMIEREAQVPSDRAKIAAVIYNRLKAGIPLGIDATIYYAVENAHDIPTYTKELTTSQLQMDSAYNTRVHKGLPPTPISNPGVASIQAAAHPAHVSYLYYVAGSDGCGEMRFATTEAKFQEDVAAYEAAKRANGGHLPACKHG